MKPLILDFVEECVSPEISMPEVYYSERLNLNVIKGTEIPVISLSALATMTKTFVQTEGSDEDPVSGFRSLLDTATGTRVLNENSDSDFSDELALNLATMTGTKTHNEVSDCDHSNMLTREY